MHDTSAGLFNHRQRLAVDDADVEGERIETFDAAEIDTAAASLPASVTIAIRPSVGWDGGINKAVSTKWRSEKFFGSGLDTDLPDRLFCA